MAGPAPKLDKNGEHLLRVRRLCSDLPGVSEKLSHGAPTFFAGKVFAMFADNVHGDGRIGLWLPVPPGEQELLLEAEPDLFYFPPYVGVKGWIAIHLAQVDDEQLAIYLQGAWKLISKKPVERPGR